MSDLSRDWPDNSKRGVPESKFDPTGLVRVECGHGLEVHPDPDIQGHFGNTRMGRSWVRSKYALGYGGVKLYGKCVVCRGDPRPDDLTTPRNASE